MAVSESGLESLQTLQAASEEAQGKWSEAIAQLSASTEPFLTGLEALEERSQALLDQVATSQDTFETDVEELVSTLAELKGQLDGFQNELEQEFTQTQAAIASLDEQVDGLVAELEDGFPALEGTVTAFMEGLEEAGQTLQQTVAETQSYLADDFVSELQAHQLDITQRAETLHSFMAEQCVSTVTEKTTEFTQHLEDVVERLKAKFKEVHIQMEQEVQTTVQRTGDEIQDRLFGDLLRTANDLEQLASRLSQVIDTTGTTIGTSKEALLTGMNTTNIGVNTVIGIFRELQELLERVS
jgi:dGTP triphosphohydrolase